jgi:hypothetical protein
MAVRLFYCQKQIERDVRQAIDLARRYFAVIGKPNFEVVHDPEHGESYLAIHLWARGEPQTVFEQSRSFRRALRNSINREKFDLINVIYHAI